jgi:MFS superfamily sulfate permease-like transporter
MRSILLERRSEFWVALITTLVVIFVGVEQGIILAIVLSLIDHTRRGYRPKNVVLVPGESGVWLAQPVTTGAQAVTGLVIYRFTHSMYYANSQQLSEEMLNLVNTAEPPLRWFCIDGSAVDDVDYTAAETIRSLYGILKDKGVHFVIAQVLEDVKAESRYHFSQLYGEDALYNSLEEVVQSYRQQTRTGV